jgi:hypothetical protein
MESSPGTGRRALQQQFGYRLEGEKRQAYRCLADGEVKDECITGLLRDEWWKGEYVGAADAPRRCTLPLGG